jgi:hypothetical protein
MLKFNTTLAFKLLICNMIINYIKNKLFQMWLLCWCSLNRVSARSDTWLKFTAGLAYLISNLRQKRRAADPSDPQLCRTLPHHHTTTNFQPPWVTCKELKTVVATTTAAASLNTLLFTTVLHKSHPSRHFIVRTCPYWSSTISVSFKFSGTRQSAMRRIADRNGHRYHYSKSKEIHWSCARLIG